MKTCKHGHPWTTDNIYVSPAGKRQCRICRNQNVQKARELTPYGELNRRGNAAYRVAAVTVAKNHPEEFTAVLTAERAKRGLPPSGALPVGRPEGKAS